MEYYIPVKPYSLLLLNYPIYEIPVLNSIGLVEPHIKESNHSRDFVFGFGDGINTYLGIVAGVGGANSLGRFYYIKLHLWECSLVQRQWQTKTIWH